MREGEVWREPVSLFMPILLEPSCYHFALKLLVIGDSIGLDTISAVRDSFGIIRHKLSGGVYRETCCTCFPLEDRYISAHSLSASLAHDDHLTVHSTTYSTHHVRNDVPYESRWIA